MTPAEMERLMLHWPAVVRRASPGWALDFALSIAKQARNPRWRPSPKQAHLMRAAVAELFEDAGDLIDDDPGELIAPAPDREGQRP